MLYPALGHEQSVSPVNEKGRPLETERFVEPHQRLLSAAPKMQADRRVHPFDERYSLKLLQRFKPVAVQAPQSAKQRSKAP